MVAVFARLARNWSTTMEMVVVWRYCNHWCRRGRSVYNYTGSTGRGQGIYTKKYGKHLLFWFTGYRRFWCQRDFQLFKIIINGQGRT